MALGAGEAGHFGDHETSVLTVAHAADATVARPTLGDGSTAALRVVWSGTVEPNNDVAGDLLLRTDQDRFYRSDGTNWVGMPPADAAAGTASLRTLGTGAQQAAAGTHLTDDPAHTFAEVDTAAQGADRILTTDQAGDPASVAKDIYERSRWVYKQGGMWYPPPGATSTTTQPQRLCFPAPMPVSEPVSLDRIAIEVTSAGEAEAVVRLGIYGPGNQAGTIPLLVDAGTVPGDATGVHPLTISETLSAGLWWLAAVPQNCPTTAPTLRSVTGTAVTAVGFPQASIASSASLYGIKQTGIDDALPDPLVPDDQASGQSFRVIVRTAP